MFYKLLAYLSQGGGRFKWPGGQTVTRKLISCNNDEKTNFTTLGDVNHEFECNRYLLDVFK